MKGNQQIPHREGGNKPPRDICFAHVSRFTKHPETEHTMGRGNWRPSMDYYRMRNIDLVSLMIFFGYDGLDTEVDLMISDLETTIQNNLPNSFDAADAPARQYSIHAEEGRVIAANGHVAIALKFHDDTVSVFAFPRNETNRYDDEPNPLSLHYLFERLPLSPVWGSLQGRRDYTNAEMSIPNRAWMSYYIPEGDLFTECIGDPR